MEIKNYDVSPDILQKSGECPHSHRCLSTPENTVCKAEYLLADQNLFVKEKESRKCNKFLSYGIAGICRCPVRVELFKRYKV